MLPHKKWDFVPLADAVDICDTLRIPINAKERQARIAGKKQGDLFPYYGATGQVGYIDDYITDGEYVLLGEDGAPFLDAYSEKAYIITGKAWVNNHAHVLRSKTNNKFLCYYLNFFNYNGFVSGTTRLKLTQGMMRQIPVPMPAVDEQERIVARIEELFSELDNGVETLRKTKQQLAVYRQAVLKESFNTESATTVEVSEIVDDIRIGPFGTMLHKSDYMVGGIPVINPQHIKNNTIIAGVNVTVSAEKAEELNAYKLKNNDIIMGRRGEMGRCAAVTQAEDGWLCGTGSILFRLKPEFDAGFYAQILSSPVIVHYLEENATGTTMKNLNEEIVRHIPVPYITREQQIAISKKIDAALSMCDNIEKTVVSSLRQAEAMRQSILKQAFEEGL